jgi:ATP-binding cassette, subfamily B, bacterial
MEGEEEEKKKKENPIFNLVREEWRHLGNRKRWFFFAAFFFVIAGAFDLLTPLVIGTVFNSVQNSINTSLELRNLILLIFSLLFIKIGFWIFHGIARYVESRNGFFVHRNYINSKMDKVLELPIKWHKDHHSGDTIDKINKGSNALFSFSSYITFQLIYAVMSIFGSLAILFFVDFKIALFALIYSCVVLFTIFKMDTNLVRYYKALNKKSNKVAAGIYDYISNIITVVTLRAKKTVQVEIDSRLMASNDLSKKSSVLREMKWAFASIMITLMVVISLSFRAYNDFYSGGIIMVGTLYILYGYLRNVGDTFYKFASLYGDISKFNASLNNAKPIDDEFEKVRADVSRDLPRDWKSVELRGVDFSYNDEGDMKHIDDINFRFKKGEKIALVGESGSGKSTVLTLLRGLYRPDKGSVYIDGKKADHGFARLKKHITLIPQDPEIFNDTIKNNITMGTRKKNVELVEAINMAQLAKVIKKLDKGLDTNVLEKGVSLSGGEKQRLSLARGLLAAKKSEIVLLDEPTSSVDSENEMKIHDNVFSKFRSKTIISSIHRLHLLNKFDYIYLFEKGRIVAQGTLSEIKKNTKFNRVWAKYGLNKEM